jgi:formylglycine-generating enzyme required for sulfatase activity
MVLIAGGEFHMGSSPTALSKLNDDCNRLAPGWVCKDRGEWEQPAHRVVIDAFFLDRHEVTNALFERFVTATGYRTTAQRNAYGSAWKPNGAGWEWVRLEGANWQEPNGVGGYKPEKNHPVVQVSWHDAGAYCEWAGKRLPTEAEWERASRGSDDRRYPWGEEWDASRANGDMTVGAPTAVGSYPAGASPYGIRDMAGNVSEWVADEFDRDYYQHSRERNPDGPHPHFWEYGYAGYTRVIRGGSWLNVPVYLRTTARFSLNPSVSLQVLGFRCARDGSE